MPVTAWSREVSVPVSRSGDHTAPSFGDTVPGHSLRNRTFTTRADELSRSPIATGPHRHRTGQAKTFVRSSRPIFEEQHLIMTETVPAHPFDDMEALAWLR